VISGFSVQASLPGVLNTNVPITLAGRSMAYICGRLFAEIMCSNHTGEWMSVSCECCVLSGRVLWNELITRPNESYRLWCDVCDLESSWLRRPWPTGGALVPNTHIKI